jgi:sortase A
VTALRGVGWRSPRGLLVGTALLVGALLLGHGAWIQAKGRLGQFLMARAWDASIERGQTPDAPWPGARTRPVARLVVPALDVDRLVLDGVDLPALAWGPGLVHGAAGHRLIAGHRDTHFRFLGDLAPGHRLSLEPALGPSMDWEVIDRSVVDGRITRIDLDAPGPLLTLATCYPVDGHHTNTPYRLIVRARPLENPAHTASGTTAWAP